jgi:hypothetical protein
MIKDEMENDAFGGSIKNKSHTVQMKQTHSCSIFLPMYVLDH